jgi:tetratricopeptide (TPR) repeat protein
VWLPCFCAYLGKIDTVLPYVEKLLTIEPHHPLSHFTAGLVNIMDGKFRTALDILRPAFESYPQDYLIQWLYSQVLLYSHLYNQADSIIEIMNKKAPDFVMAKMALATLLGLHKKKEEALPILKDQNIEAFARSDFGASYYLAESYTVLDQKKEALEWLEHSVELGFMNFQFLEKTNPLLENIRGEPRFMKLMERVKYEWENFEM